MTLLVDSDDVARRRHGALRRDEVRAVDVDALEAELRRVVRGEVRFGPGDRAMHAVDAGNFRQMPIGVVCPVDASDVIAAVAACRELDAPIVGRGGGTSLAGQTCNTAVVLDFSRHMRDILWVDPETRTARVQPGVTCDQLREAATLHGLWWGPDPATHDHNSFGGMIANNSCGVHALAAGRTTENVVSLRVLTYDGCVLEVGETDDETYRRVVTAGGRPAEIYRELRALRDRYGDLVRARYPKIPRRVSGYNLDDLLPEHGFHLARALVGSEGTCALTLEATVRLLPLPGARHLVVIGYDDVYAAADDLDAVLPTGPIGLEGVDQQLVRDMQERQVHLSSIPLLPEGHGWLMAEYGGATIDEAREAAAVLVRELEARGFPQDRIRRFEGDLADTVWQARESGQWATALHPVRGFAFPGWEDSAVPPEKLSGYLRDFRALLQEFGYTAALFGHFGQGCVHCNIDFDLETEQGIAQYRRFLERASDLVSRYGGSYSGEHGDGQQRGELLAKMFGEDLVEAMRRFKAIWDPRNRLNPGKVVDAPPLDADLRLGAGYREQLWEPETVFQWPEDDHRFSHAAQRCIGVGQCRRTEGGTMCPSYKATREERHSTRGRTHLLWEMLQSDSPIDDGWKSEEVKSALDLCLACKGCKAECPMQVDVATYKAEFLYHHWKGRLRPRIHHVFGRIFQIAPILVRLAPVVNALTRAPGISRLVNRALGMHPDRPLPPFAPETFRRWYRQHPRPSASRPKVVLWADTWTNHLWPEVGISAVELLEAAGWDVVVLDRKLCCGRPLFEFGLLEAAKHQVRKVLDAVEPLRRENVPVVVLEPSCGSVLVDEAHNLFPDDPAATWLREHTWTLEGFLDTWADDLDGSLEGVRVALHRHCHHKSEFPPSHGSPPFERLGAKVDVLSSGCCGMAGGFGFDADTYETSVEVAHTEFLPALGQHGASTVVVADGYSCRSQAKDLADREAYHPAEVLALAARRATVTPEALADDARDRRGRIEALAARRRGLGAVLLAATAAVLALLGRRRRA
jgi:FAD/FMN-containing dehydrogenase/Fe-S oxidoreductase